MVPMASQGYDSSHLNEEEIELVDELLRYKGWPELNETQSTSVENGILRSSRNFVVIAPTASGKTGVAELAMLQTLKSGRRVAYLVPLASIVNEKKEEFSYLSDDFTIYPNGDVNFSSADVAIMTFEQYYRTALLRPYLIETFGLVIIDEFHILYDQYRGYNLEKVLTMCKILKQRMICLSATFERKEHIQEWLDAQIIDIPESARKVPLEHRVLDLSVNNGDRKLRELFNYLETNTLYPAIIFCNTRNYTQSRARKFSDFSVDINDIDEVRSDFVENLGTSEFTQRTSNIIEYISKGVAFHHAGLHSSIKKTVESYFRADKINYLFCTPTLAYGVNFPAKTVVLYDLTFWTNEGRIPVPVHLYLQMAGRAGRPQYGTEGYGIVIGTNADELTRLVPPLVKRQIAEAESNIGYDDYFQKTIMELIFSGRNKEDDIIGFFENTFYNYLATRQTTRLAAFNLIDTIARHTGFLIANNFIVTEGPTGFRLIDLGEISIKFLLDTYTNYDLRSFIKLNNYLNQQRIVQSDFELIYNIFLMFEQISLYKRPHRASTPIVTYFVNNYNKARRDVKNLEYSAYATFFGWIENMNDVRIENDFQVYPDNIPHKMRELGKILTVYRTLAERKFTVIPSEFDVLLERIEHGVTEEELPFKKERGIGRDTCRILNRYCEIFRNEPWNIKGSLLEILIEVNRRIGESNLLNTHLKYIQGIAEARGAMIIEVIKRHL